MCHFDTSTTDMIISLNLEAIYFHWLMLMKPTQNTTITIINLFDLNYELNHFLSCNNNIQVLYREFFYIIITKQGIIYV